MTVDIITDYCENTNLINTHPTNWTLIDFIGNSLRCTADHFLTYHGAYPVSYAACTQHAFSKIKT